ncbi:MAG: serine/threonine-protein kinase [Thermogemmata sp.]|nr:serine/threonine-protein kinase [Thermogemmata sp.]
MPRTAILSHVPCYQAVEADSAVSSTPPPLRRHITLLPGVDWTENQEHSDKACELRAGDTFHGFELVEELGQGAFARVFLARQQALAGRFVVLKITRRPTREAERLARLQHTNVVPVYSIHEAPPLQIICMPFLGRRTVADVLKQHRLSRLCARQGSSGWRLSLYRRWRSTQGAADATVANESKEHIFVQSSQHPPVSPVETTLIGQPLAVLRLLSQLSAGLQHAHERGILHLDIKPANVLLADTGEPMLFDFNLAFDASEQDRELIGGTVPYMAPEQLEDMRCRGQGHIDARADLYALGVMAWELLTGDVPFPAGPRGLVELDQLIAARQTPLPSLQQLNPAVTPAVEAIVRKLLAPKPEDRYRSASELKTDIDRHLANQPLLYAPEPSLRERFQKWRRRHPRLLRRITLAVSLLMTLSTGGLTYLYVEDQAVAAARAKYQAVLPRIQSAHIELLVRGEFTWQEQGREHAFRILQEYGLLYDPDWRNRPDFQRLPPAEQQELISACADLLVLVVQSRWIDDQSRPPAIRRQAAAELLQLARYAQQLYAEQNCPPLLQRQLEQLTRALQEDDLVHTASGPSDVAEVGGSEVRTLNGRDQYLEAAADLLAEQYAQAQQRLEPLITQRPFDGLVHFWLGFCSQQLNRPEQALDRYNMAATLLPHDPRPVFFRGMVNLQLLRHAIAEQEFSEAMMIMPAEPAYYRCRALTRMRLKKYPEALADLNSAIELFPEDIQAYLYRAWVWRAMGNEAAAVEDKQTAFTIKPLTAGDYISRGVELMRHYPQQALREFQAAEILNPRAAAALYNQAHLLQRDNRLLEALEVSHRLVSRCPNHALGWTMHATILARLQRREEAHQAVSTALQVSQDLNVLLRCAAVFAMTSRTVARDAHQAIELLEKALHAGLRNVEMLEDPVYWPLRAHKRYQELLTSARQLFPKRTIRDNHEASRK